jgi:hypothetical protein
MVKQPEMFPGWAPHENVLVMEMLTLRQECTETYFSAYMNKHAAAAIVDLSKLVTGVTPV